MAGTEFVLIRMNVSRMNVRVYFDARSHRELRPIPAEAYALISSEITTGMFSNNRCTWKGGTAAFECRR